MELARAKGMEPVIPSKRNRKEQREHDWERYKASGGKHLTLFEAMARNCDKIRQKTGSFVAAVQMCFTYLWASIL